MIGEKLIYYNAYKKVTDFLRTELSVLIDSKAKFCISIGGESGCGKSSLAYAIYKDLEKETGLKGFLFHGDDYFKLPPKDNHNSRVLNIAKVGVEEVDLELIDSHLLQFKMNKNDLIKPLVNYSENKIGSEKVNALNYDFCIVEGAYATLLKNSDYKIFMTLTYLDTKKNRLKRARDIMNDFNEQVLNIEHKIIKEHNILSNMIIDKELNIEIKKSTL
jgi:uridine kinase